MSGRVGADGPAPDRLVPGAVAPDRLVPGGVAPDRLVPGAVAPDRLPADLRAAVEAATTARLFLPGGPAAYDTGSWLRLRADHAAARDAVHSELDLTTPALAGMVARHAPMVVETAAPDAAGYLTRPDLGRRLSAPSARALRDRLSGAEAPLVGRVELAVVVGDGLSATAVEAHAAQLVQALVEGAGGRGWRVREPVIVVRRCRVGILNDLGPLLDADVVVLLVGERPGLAAADSLSAYLAYRPGAGHTDADRNLVSGIHDRGTPVGEAARRVLDLAGLLLTAGRSGVSVKEELAGRSGVSVREEPAGSIAPAGGARELGEPGR